jgi:formylglycine-generating enzyme required for sulfatase activity
MFCGQCGHEVEPSWHFCPFCQQSLDEAEAPSTFVAEDSAFRVVASSQEALAATAPVPQDHAKHYRDSLAVVLGVTRYGEKHLPHAEADGEQMQRILDHLRFPAGKVIQLWDSQVRHSRLVQLFKTILPARLKARSRLILFWVGAVHDWQHEAGEVEPVLLPWDSDPAWALRTGIPFGQLCEWLSALALYDCFLVVDACSAGIASVGGDGDPLTLALRRKKPAVNCVQLLSAGMGGQKLYRTEGHSVFMEMLGSAVGGEARREGEDLLRGRDVGSFVAREVSALTVGRQTPVMRQVAGEGDLLLIPYTKPERTTTSIMRGLGPTFNLTSEPEGATVTVNGKIRGKTPWEARLHPGRYDLKVAAAGYETYHEPLEWPGKSPRLHVELNRAQKRDLPPGLSALTSECCPVTHLPLRVLRKRDQAEMVLVGPGSLVMGCKKGLDDESPLHVVRVAPFYVDRYPVTNDSYELFMRAHGAPRPSHWRKSGFSSSHQPVVGVMWEEAIRYCDWVGAALPTEAQWERAAKGAEDRYFPWGNTVPTPRLARYRGSREQPGPVPVRYFSSNVSPCGAQQMAGNAWEWCLDWYDPAYYVISPESDPAGPEWGSERVVRGGAWTTGRGFLRCACRGHLVPDYREPDVGFRCVLPCRPEGADD